MKQAIQTEATKRATAYMAQNGINHEFNWDKPRSEDFKVWEQLKQAGVLVDRRGQLCAVVNRYGPNPHNLIDYTAIESKYGGIY